jgi:hypothetical protein
MIEPNRIIEIEGSGLLVPTYEPQIPAGIRPGEVVRVVPPCPPWRATSAADVTAIFDGQSPEDHRYWYLGESYDRKLPYVDRWEGDPGKPSRAGLGLGLERILASTVLHLSAPSGKVRFPDFRQHAGLLIVSDRLLELWRRIDPSAIMATPVIIKGSDGQIVSDHHSFVDVVRNLAAIDIANSIVQYRGPHSGYPAHFAGTVSSRIRDDLDPSFGIFRQKLFGSDGGNRIIVSAMMRKHMDALRPKLSNVDFRACGMS